MEDSNLYHVRLMMALDSQPSWTRPVTYEGNPLPDTVDGPPYVFGELEMIPGPQPGRSNPGHSTTIYDLPQRRSIEPKVDTKLIRTWLDSCKHSNHSNASHCAGSERLWDGKGLRLIDVQLRCLVNVAERYISPCHTPGEKRRVVFYAPPLRISTLSIRLGRWTLTLWKSAWV